MHIIYISEILMTQLLFSYFLKLLVDVNGAFGGLVLARGPHVWQNETLVFNPFSL